ncbi:uncharacterized protein MONOS_4698 [Monocercomonoides exilis]|uniref:uncharacterized protein n=1 Tax=Monocercomonoides exilis TaxID=2049356 RepID=UPI00355968C1|nr:hypothetical protein MONOS_4698 [Monocercomonoides exilis]|eukprot:MONOS_4698.1-p1 / transcript=MONOS_4698.1 / gene=MONOS_4698 / organism=Monocercomonoides_exilis_PA203 / gene_product=unspecified product / transcript_product=unspecified product / location=Mono_scaffold00128:7976-12928(+) / protein_length=1616 / sequence_SO=supercontig / SO=protein_coding / is_pseudo=false
MTQRQNSISYYFHFLKSFETIVSSIPDELRQSSTLLAKRGTDENIVRCYELLLHNLSSSFPSIPLDHIKAHSLAKGEQGDLRCLDAIFKELSPLKSLKKNNKTRSNKNINQTEELQQQQQHQQSIVEKHQIPKLQLPSSNLFAHQSSESSIPYKQLPQTQSFHQAFDEPQQKSTGGQSQIDNQSYPTFALIDAPSNYSDNYTVNESPKYKTIPQLNASPSSLHDHQQFDVSFIHSPSYLANGSSSLNKEATSNGVSFPAVEFDGKEFQQNYPPASQIQKQTFDSTEQADENEGQFQISDDTRLFRTKSAPSTSLPSPSSGYQPKKHSTFEQRMDMPDNILRNNIGGSSDEGMRMMLRLARREAGISTMHSSISSTSSSQSDTPCLLASTSPATSVNSAEIKGSPPSSYYASLTTSSLPEPSHTIPNFILPVTYQSHNSLRSSEPFSQHNIVPSEAVSIPTQASTSPTLFSSSSPEALPLAQSVYPADSQYNASCIYSPHYQSPQQLQSGTVIDYLGYAGEENRKEIDSAQHQLFTHPYSVPNTSIFPHHSSGQEQQLIQQGNSNEQQAKEGSIPKKRAMTSVDSLLKYFDNEIVKTKVKQKKSSTRDGYSRKEDESEDDFNSMALSFLDSSLRSSLTTTLSDSRQSSAVTPTMSVAQAAFQQKSIEKLQAAEKNREQRKTKNKKEKVLKFMKATVELLRRSLLEELQIAVKEHDPKDSKAQNEAQSRHKSNRAEEQKRSRSTKSKSEKEDPFEEDYERAFNAETSDEDFDTDAETIQPEDFDAETLGPSTGMKKEISDTNEKRSEEEEITDEEGFMPSPSLKKDESAKLLTPSSNKELQKDEEPNDTTEQCDLQQERRQITDDHFNTELNSKEGVSDGREEAQKQFELSETERSEMKSIRIAPTESEYQHQPIRYSVVSSPVIHHTHIVVLDVAETEEEQKNKEDIPKKNTIKKKRDNRQREQISDDDRVREERPKYKGKSCRKRSRSCPQNKNNSLKGSRSHSTNSEYHSHNVRRVPKHRNEHSTIHHRKQSSLSSYEPILLPDEETKRRSESPFEISRREDYDYQAEPDLYSYHSDIHSCDDRPAEMKYNERMEDETDTQKSCSNRKRSSSELEEGEKNKFLRCTEKEEERSKVKGKKAHPRKSISKEEDRPPRKRRSKSARRKNKLNESVDEWKQTHVSSDVLREEDMKDSRLNRTRDEWKRSADARKKRDEDSWEMPAQLPLSSSMMAPSQTYLSSNSMPHPLANTKSMSLKDRSSYSKQYPPSKQQLHFTTTAERLRRMSHDADDEQRAINAQKRKKQKVEEFSYGRNQTMKRTMNNFYRWELDSLRSRLEAIHQRRGPNALMEALATKAREEKRESAVWERNMKREVSQREQALKKRLWENDITEIETGIELLKEEMERKKKERSEMEREELKEMQKMEAAERRKMREKSKELEKALLELDRIEGMGKLMFVDRERSAFLRSIGQPKYMKGGITCSSKRPSPVKVLPKNRLSHSFQQNEEGDRTPNKRFHRKDSLEHNSLSKHPARFYSTSPCTSPSTNPHQSRSRSRSRSLSRSHSHSPSHSRSSSRSASLARSSFGERAHNDQKTKQRRPDSLSNTVKSLGDSLIME